MKYKVHLQAQKQTFEAADEQTLLDAALSAEVAVAYGCQSGGCGACRARLVSGQVDYLYDPPALSEAEKDAGYMLLCQARPCSDLEIEVEALPDNQTIPVRSMPVRVEQREVLAHDVMCLRLKLPKGEVFSFLAGQYVDVLLRDGRRRSYSIASGPHEKAAIELHMRKVDGGDFSDYVFNTMQDRAILRIEGPLGGFYLREESTRPILMMAGGTGLAPVKAMLEQLIQQGQQRPVHLFWGVRAKRDLYLHTQLLSWAEQHHWFTYTAVLSEPQSTDAWSGSSGFVHAALLQAYPSLSAHEVYMSGPPVMIEAAKEAFLGCGLAAEHLHYDSFDYAFQTWPEKEAGNTANA